MRRGQSHPWGHSGSCVCWDILHPWGRHHLIPAQDITLEMFLCSILGMFGNTWAGERLWRLCLCAGRCPRFVPAPCPWQGWNKVIFKISSILGFCFRIITHNEFYSLLASWQLCNAAKEISLCSYLQSSRNFTASRVT